MKIFDHEKYEKNENVLKNNDREENANINKYYLCLSVKSAANSRKPARSLFSINEIV